MTMSTPPNPTVARPTLLRAEANQHRWGSKLHRRSSSKYLPGTVFGPHGDVGAGVCTDRAVSNPFRGTEPRDSIWSGCGPASTSQVETSVAPFQLA